ASRRAARHRRDLRGDARSLRHLARDPGLGRRQAHALDAQARAGAAPGLALVRDVVRRDAHRLDDAARAAVRLAPARRDAEAHALRGALRGAWRHRDALSHRVTAVVPEIADACPRPANRGAGDSTGYTP